MSDRLLRLAAAAAVAGALAQVVAGVLEPEWGSDPGEAVRVVADSGFWTANQLLDLVGLFLTVGAFTVVGHTFHEGSGRQWARVGQPFLVLMGALGAGAIVAGANMKELADSWVGATPEAKQPYLAAFDAATGTTEDLLWVALLALGLYVAVLAAAILTGRIYARWIGWVAAAGAALLVVGDLLELVLEAAFVAVLAGFVLSLAVLVAVGVSMWRHAATPIGQRRASPAADPHLA